MPFVAFSHSMIGTSGVLGRIKMAYQIFLYRISINRAKIGDAHVGKVDVNLRHYRRLRIGGFFVDICRHPSMLLFLAWHFVARRTLAFHPLLLFLLLLLAHMLICL